MPQFVLYLHIYDLVHLIVAEFDVVTSVWYIHHGKLYAEIYDSFLLISVTKSVKIRFFYFSIFLRMSHLHFYCICLASSGYKIHKSGIVMDNIFNSYTHLVIYRTHPYITNSNGGNFQFVVQCNRNQQEGKNKTNK